MVRARHHRYTYEEYRTHEATSNVKHEYLDGEIYAMAGGTPEHAALAAAFLGILHTQLKGSPSRSFTSDLRVHVLATDFASYPDATIVCGEMLRDPSDRMAVTNPTVIVEVLSDGTEDFDRNEKREHYQRISSLQEYVLVSHREQRIEIWRRAEDGWSRESVEDGQIATLRSIACKVPLEDLYTGVLG